ncbi:hypothetical protein [Anabaena sp. CCY 9910]|uniref:hypothetical protein n=1 Tax=Anabaena sp. CCY 9910 TaxID=3103870 RepID=UPI0039E18970
MVDDSHKDLLGKCDVAFTYPSLPTFLYLHQATLASYLQLIFNLSVSETSDRLHQPYYQKCVEALLLVARHPMIFIKMPNYFPISLNSASKPEFAYSFALNAFSFQ